MHKYVYWYCPKCGKLFNCFLAEQFYNCKCNKCSTALKATEISCLDGVCECTERWYYDYRLICELYLKNDLTPEALAIVEENISPADEAKYKDSHHIKCFMQHFQPKIDAWKFMIENGQEPEINWKEELDKFSQWYDPEAERYRIQESEKYVAQLQAQRPKCPTCGSTNIKKISDLERGVSVGMWGLFSSKIGKTMKCNSCGHKW